MTALCGGGASGPKSGVAQSILYTMGGAEALALFSGAEWFSPWAALLGQIAYNTADSCTTDPPGYPTLTADDFFAAVNPVDPIAYFNALFKLRQWMLTFLWYQNCQCTPGGALTNPVPHQPNNLPTIAASAGSACQTTNFSNGPAPPNNTFFAAPNIGCPGVGVTLTNCVSNPTSYFWTFGIDATVPTGPNATFHAQVRNAGVFRNSANVVLTPGHSSSISMPFQAGDDLAQLVVSMATGTGVNNVSAQGFVYCNGTAPNSAAGPCCPPDPSLMSVINQILANTQLIQRYKVPFAYVRGASHSGLTGTGTITVPNSLIGLEMALTTIPGRVGSESAQPDYVWDTGWWSVETVDAVVDERRLRHASQLWFPPFMPSVTKVGYYLTPGVVATLTELQAEP